MEKNNFIDDELKDIVPNLFKMDRSNPFTVPDGYFESLPNIISDRILAQKKKSLREIIAEILFQPKYALATCAIAVLIGTGIYFKMKSNEFVSLQTATVTTDEIINSPVMDQLDETVISDELAYNLEQKSTTEAADDTKAEDYLIDNQTDISTIVNEL